jgi:predicted membrane-bound mannosyltransferase
MNWRYTVALLLVAAGALALRLPQLDRRPLHADESVHTIKFRGLWDQGVYRYDPQEYHGPSLY